MAVRLRPSVTPCVAGEILCDIIISDFQAIRHLYLVILPNQNHKTKNTLYTTVSIYALPYAVRFFNSYVIAYHSHKTKDNVPTTKNNKPDKLYVDFL